MADKEYIEREALLKDIEESVRFSVKSGNPSLEVRGANKITDRIKSAPTADVVEVRHGEWIKKEDEYYVCSECGRTRPYNRYTYSIDNWACNYCRWCGAKMGGKGEGE